MSYKILKSKAPFLVLRENKEYSFAQRAKIKRSQDIYDYSMINLYNDGDINVYESFYILFLNNANTITGYTKISQGGITGTVVDLRIISKYIADFMPTSIILIHNHPSGTLHMSDHDITITQKIKDLCQVMNVHLLDHIICTFYSYTSFADEGKL